ncbi:MAG: glycosyltransferase [Pseudomonadota bacterium]
MNLERMTLRPENHRQDTQLNPGHKTLRVGYVLSYRDPHYIRSTSILKALSTCADVQLFVARNNVKGLWRYVETWRALRKLKKIGQLDIYILGFRGHEIFWPVRWMTRGSALAFDALMSPYAALLEESKAGLIGKLIAPLVYRLEKAMLQRADLVLTDTQEHTEYYARTFALLDAKVCSIPVGAIENQQATVGAPLTSPEHFSILFYGSFLPLHGIRVIVAAAAQLRDLPIHFDFIGGTSKQARQLRRMCMQSDVTCYTHRRWVPLQDLLHVEIPRATLCAGGPFGGTPQAQRVITGKTSQGLACGKATIVGRIDEDYGFVDRINCLLVDQKDPDALAETIRWAYENSAQLAHIGARGLDLYNKRLSVSVIAEKLLPYLQHVTKTYSESTHKK